ncbi:LysR family transcriptional regulator [Streptomyces sp. NPDC002012]|uniref:LysR family transcriptional regulator n=1 Tax=Streptomyces TaxID=1883 RepID=UPI001670F2B1|nr:LysR family transcriptional regulator [Streptomyces atratus]WPW26405.1 LysR family transcriptional regulator [Streptomyces atratus]GGT68287.1 LysR family transcriptional regulator [Streptomyces atratus]
MLERLELEAFLTLSEELHFGRTANRLHVTTARISQTIKRLERHIGTPLFERSSRHVCLTEAGRLLHDDLRPAYDQIEAGLEKATNAARGVGGVLQVGFLGAAAGQLMVQAAQLFDRRHPGWRARPREMQIVDGLRRLRAGDVDLLVVSLPHHEPDMVTGPVLFSEPRVLGVSSRHPLARRDSVSLEDLAAVKMLQVAGAFPDYWRADRTPHLTPAGRPVEPGPQFETLQEALALIDAGEGAFVMGAQVSRFYARPGVAYLPLSDAPPLEWAPTWLVTNTAPQIHAFNQAAQNVAVRASPAVRN